MSANTTQDKQDFRVKAAREKREKMRARLLDATLEIYQPNDKGPEAVIDDVVKKAGVSRGTFYKYFDSLDEAIESLGEHLADDMLRSYETIFSESLEDSAYLAGGTVITLARAAMEPRWGIFISHVDFINHLSDQRSLSDIVTKPLLEGKHQGLLHFTAIEAAADMLIGATVEATKRLAHGQQQNQAYILEVAQCCMQGLGMDQKNAKQSATTAWQRLKEHQKQLSWWQELL